MRLRRRHEDTATTAHGLLLATLLATLCDTATGQRLFYQTGRSEADLPECGPRAVCNRVDTYGTPWVERQCRCPNDAPCPRGLDADDGYTVRDKWRLLKTCEPVRDLPRCRYFRDAVWTVEASPGNGTMRQTVHCLCPGPSVAYIFKHRPQNDPRTPLRYTFACSPISRLRCQRKEPCRLFTVRKRPGVEEVNASTLCQCPRGWRCPSKHTDAVPGARYDRVRTYSAYCTGPQ
ncbi:protein giant-lens [Ixodes scapularis]|nr:protein giant-lens [Ixodes scapularis]